MHQVLITGSSGYIGTSIAEALFNNGYKLKLASRKKHILCKNQKVSHIKVSKDFAAMSWRNYLNEVDTIIFCAGVAHEDEKKLNNQEIESFYDVNLKAASNLAKQAKDAKISKFIYLSTAGIHGRFSKEKITELSQIVIENNYTKSKFLAEKSLNNIFKGTEVDLVILRIPMVYGFRAPGNPRKSVELLKKGFVPVKGLNNNKRSFIFIENLKSAILFLMKTEDRSGTFCLSDSFNYSTLQYFEMLATIHKIPFKAIFVPKFVFYIFAFITRKSVFKSLYSDMEISNEKFFHIFKWTPPFDSKSKVIKYSLNEGSKKEYY